MGEYRYFCRDCGKELTNKDMKNAEWCDECDRKYIKALEIREKKLHKHCIPRKDVEDLIEEYEKEENWGAYYDLMNDLKKLLEVKGER